MSTHLYVPDYSSIKRRALPLLELAAKELGIDLLALAIYDMRYSELKWCAAYGSLNGRYSHISLRVGSGLAGKVFRDNEILRFPLKDSDDNPTAYPIVGVERLEYAVAVPVGSGRDTLGVLLAGNRSARSIAEDSGMEILQLVAEQLRLLFDPRMEEEVIDLGGGLEQSSLFLFMTKELKTNPLPITVEFLDHRITSLPDQRQEALVSLFREMLQPLKAAETESVHILIEKQGDPYVAVLYKVHGSIVYTDAEMKKWSESVRRIGGVVHMEKNEEQFSLLIRYPFAFIRS